MLARQVHLALQHLGACGGGVACGVVLVACGVVLVACGVVLVACGVGVVAQGSPQQSPPREMLAAQKRATFGLASGRVLFPSLAIRRTREHAREHIFWPDPGTSIHCTN